MKLRILFLTFLLFNLAAPKGKAINRVSSLSSPTQSGNILSNITVSQFLSLDFDKIQESNLVSLNWMQKSLLKSAQKRLAKKVSKGKIDASQSLLNKSAAAKGENRRGMFSLIFGGAGFLFLFLGPLAYLSLPLGIAGLILGIIGVKKDKNDTMAIIGMVFGSLVILLFLLAAVLIASFFI